MTCITCNGSGVIPANVIQLDPDTEPEMQLCPDCVLRAKCPNCGHLILQADDTSLFCSVCEWKENPVPEPEPEPDPTDIEVEIKAKSSLVSPPRPPAGTP